jgi:AraC family transcriptional regulator
VRIAGNRLFASGHHEMRWAEVSEPTEALEIYPNTRLLQHVTEVPHLGAMEIEPVIAAHDATVLGIAAILRRAHIHDGADLDAMQVSTLGHRLLEHMADHYCHPRHRRARRAGRLDRTLVDRIAEFVDDHVAEQLTLDDLARQARLSVYHFARAFKATTGMAPHEFVTMRRLERAKELLLRTRYSVMEVAFAVGYSDVGHFRRLLRRYAGFAPSALREISVGRTCV